MARRSGNRHGDGMLRNRLRDSLRNVGTPTLLIVALIVALSAAGGATAASFVTGKQVRNGTLTGADVKNRSIKRRDLAKGLLRSAGGSPGAAGPQGPKGDTGEKGRDGAD